MAQDTFNAKSVATDASKMLGRPVSPKQVRGLARGDSGPAVIARLDDEGYTPHAYSAKERRMLLEAFAARESRRTGRKVSVPAVKGEGPTPKRTPKPKPAEDVTPTDPRDAG